MHCIRLRCSYNACMPAVTIRDVPGPVRNELASRAARAGQSLQEYLLHHLTEFVARPTVEDSVARARARLLSSRSQVTTEQILDDLTADRR